MHERWPFLRALLSNMDMVLGKSDIGIASRYAELVTDSALRERIFGAIRAEWELQRALAPGDHGPAATAGGESRSSPAASATASPTSIP